MATYCISAVMFYILHGIDIYMGKGVITEHFFCGHENHPDHFKKLHFDFCSYDSSSSSTATPTGPTLSTWAEIPLPLISSSKPSAAQEHRTLSGQTILQRMGISTHHVIVNVPTERATVKSMKKLIQTSWIHDVMQTDLSSTSVPQYAVPAGSTLTSTEAFWTANAGHTPSPLCTTMAKRCGGGQETRHNRHRKCGALLQPARSDTARYPYWLQCGYSKHCHKTMGHLWHSHSHWPLLEVSALVNHCQTTTSMPLILLALAVNGTHWLTHWLTQRAAKRLLPCHFCWKCE